MANIPFPNERIDLGVNEPFIRDLQDALNVAETGVYDFLNLCHVIVHKFRHGLDHNDPTVNANTWNSIMETAHGQSPEDAANEAARGGGENDRPEEPADDTPRAAIERAAAAGEIDNRAAADDRRDEAPRDGVATTGQIDRNGGNVDTD